MSDKKHKAYKQTHETIEIILNALSDGMTQRDASMLAGISEDTLCLWKRSNSELSEQMRRKVIEYKQKLMKTIERASEKDWKASAWLLERKFKRDFSREPKLEEDHTYDFPRLDFNMRAIADRVLEKL